MTSRGQISIDVVADTSKVAAQIRRDLEAIVKTIRLSPVDLDADVTPFARKARDAVSDADKSFSGLFARLRTQAGAAGAGIGRALGAGLGAAIASSVGPAVSSVVALLSSIGPAAIAAIPAAVGVLGTLKVALFGVGDALKEVGDEEKFNEALKTLSPNAAKFARAIRSVLPELTKLRLGVQDRFFRDFDSDVKAATKTLTGPLSAGMNATADTLNKIVRQITAFVSSAKGAAVVNTIFDVTSKVLARISDLFTPLLNRVGEWIVKAGDSGVNSAFEAAEATLRALVGTAKNVGAAIGSVFGGLGKDGPTVAAALEKASGAVRDFLASAQAQELLKTLGDTMDRVREIALKILADLPKLLPAVNGLATGGFGVLLGSVEALGNVLGPLAEKLGGQEALFVRVGQAIVVVTIATKAYQTAVIAATIAQAAWTAVLAAFDVVMGTTTLEVSGFRLAVALLGASFAPVTAQITLLISALWSQVTVMAAAALGYIRIGLAAVASAAQQAAALAVVSAQWLVLAARQALATLGLTLYGVALRAGRVAVIAWTAAQWLLNAAMTANPIGIIILLIVALVAAVVIAYQKSDTFRAIVDAAFRAIGVAALWLWNNAIKPMFEFWSVAIDFVIAAVKLWFSFIVGTFQGIAAIALWLWNAWKAYMDFIIGAVVGVATAIGDFVGTVVGWFTGLATSVGMKIGTMISFVTSIPGKITAAIGNLGNLLKDAGSKIIQGLIDGIDAMIQKLKNKIGSVAGAIKDFFPSSPAKVGPLSGDGDPERSGMRIVDRLADGVDKRRGNLRTSIAALAADLAMVPTAAALNGQVRGGDGASAAATPQPAGLRVWSAQPKAAPMTLVIQSDGTRHSQLLVEEISKAVRLRGGIVQNVLGKNLGGVQ